MHRSELTPIFDRINARHFDGFLDPIFMRWNSRLRSSAGRFIPGRHSNLEDFPPVIELASYLLEEERAMELIEDTLAHELIHYWLWVRRQPHGHTPAFLKKMKQMGVSRYNSVPRLRPFRYLYLCGACKTQFPAKKKLGVLACAKCCEAYSNGRFDSRFKLALEKQLSRAEGFELLQKRRLATPAL